MSLMMKQDSRSSRLTGSTRRQFVAGFSSAAFSAASLPCLNAQITARAPAVSARKRAVLLVQPTGLIRQLDTRSKIVLELDGKLRIKQTQAKNDQDKGEADVKGKSTLDYFEKIAFNVDNPATCVPLAAARRYIEAGVENWIAGSAASFKLRPECLETRMLFHEGQWQEYCPSCPLDEREVQLLRSPVNTAAIELLLPVEPAKPDSTWTVRVEDVKHVFNLDAVHKSTLQAKISKVESGVATIELAGDLEATANSVPTRLSVKGNFQARLASQCALVTWLGLVIKEDREISQAEPGFGISARVRMIREEATGKISVGDDSLRDLAVQQDPGRWLVRLNSAAGKFTMLADRRWHIHLDSGEDAILRMVENNTVIAQCNITRLSELEAGQQLTVEGLQADIRTSLGEGFGSILQASEKLTSTKLRLIRTVVIGELENVPIQWIYAHLSDDKGRRVVMIFTMAGNVTDRFAAADDQMSGSFEFLADSTTDPSPAAPKLTAQKAIDPKR